jgi:hypothetical protein
MTARFASTKRLATVSFHIEPMPDGEAMVRWFIGAHEMTSIPMPSHIAAQDLITHFRTSVLRVAPSSRTVG